MIEAYHLKKEFTRPVKDADGNKTFGRRTKENFYAVNDISFKADKGEILGILGPNGAGKTTLLRMLGELMTPTEGEVRIYDQDGRMITDSVEIKNRLGYLSNNTALYGRFTPRELFLLFGEMYGISREENEKRAKEVFQILQMEEFCDKRIEKLSTGQKQRASISRCLIHNPEIYIFDEPTLGLDIIASESIIEFMKQEKASGKTVLYSTHYMEEAQYLCDKILMIYEGKKLAFGTPQQLMKITDSTNLRDTFKVLISDLGEEIAGSDFLSIKKEKTEESDEN